jgi:hypothetical protein
MSGRKKVLGGALAALLTASTLLAVGCGGGLSTRLTTPQEGKMLLIGSVIVENVGYRQRRESYVQGIEVSIMGDEDSAGEMKRVQLTFWADDNGYFCVENVAYGRYTLKGIRINSPGGDWTIWNELRMPNERWVVGSIEMRYPFTGDFFYFSPNSNVYNFQHNIFSVVLGGDVYYQNRPLIRGEAFQLNDTYTRGFVEEYFIEKYPDSGWRPILEGLLPANR